MTWDADAELWGASVVATIGADYRLRLPTYPGGCRFYDLTASTGGLKVRLPNAQMLRCGPSVLTILNRAGGNAIDIVAQDGSTVIVTLAADRLLDLHLMANTTANGTWVYEVITSPAVGTPLTIGREPFSVPINSSGAQPISLRRAIDGQGYQGANPVALYCEVAAGVVRGSLTTGTPAIDTGEFPTGSTLLMVMRGSIIGCGGVGGAGGSTAGGGGNGSDGADGGPALAVRLTASLVNLGTIQGGGGGGGGGKGSGAQGGGGGGGGSGYLGAQGAAGGTGAQAGSAGGQTDGGVGGVGANNGGSGGFAGSSGTAGSGAGGGAGGTAGDAIQKFNGITLTKIRTGTIYGSEVSL